MPFKEKTRHHSNCLYRDKDTQILLSLKNICLTNIFSPFIKQLYKIVHGNSDLKIYKNTEFFWNFNNFTIVNY